MRKTWMEPKIEAQQFMPNEYVASSCGAENLVYKFECTAPGGNLYYYPNGDGEVDGIYNGTGSGTYLGSYHPCSAAHEASTTSPYYDGYVDRNYNRKCDSGEEVIVWRGANGDNGHATAELNMDSWITAKS